jgi:hypothetical protein
MQFVEADRTFTLLEHLLQDAVDRVLSARTSVWARRRPFQLKLSFARLPLGQFSEPVLKAGQIFFNGSLFRGCVDTGRVHIGQKDIVLFCDRFVVLVLLRRPRVCR